MPLSSWSGDSRLHFIIEVTFMDLTWGNVQWWLTNRFFIIAQLFNIMKGARWTPAAYSSLAWLRIYGLLLPLPLTKSWLFFLATSLRVYDSLRFLLGCIRTYTHTFSLVYQSVLVIFQRLLYNAVFFWLRLLCYFRHWGRVIAWVGSAYLTLFMQRLHWVCCISISKSVLDGNVPPNHLKRSK